MASKEQEWARPGESRHFRVHSQLRSRSEAIREAATWVRLPFSEESVVLERPQQTVSSAVNKVKTLYNACMRDFGLKEDIELISTIQVSFLINNNV